MLTETSHLAIANTVFPVTDSYVEVVPGNNHSRTYTDPDTYILCTAASDPAYTGSSMTQAQIESELVGRVLHVRNSQHGQSWYYTARSGFGGGCYVDGPVLNPTPINGHHYRELIARDEENVPFILRYNDDAHVADRRDPRHAWTIVDSPHRMTVGQGRVEDPSYWVEVNWPAAQVDIEEIFETEDAEEPVEEPPGTIINDVLSYTMGKAESDDGGVALLDPDRVVGEMYLTWVADSMNNRNITNVQVWSEGDSGPGWVHIGHFIRSVDSDPMVRFSADLWGDGGNADLSTFHWAKLALEQHVPDGADEAERVARLEAQLEAEHEAFEDLNDALNDLARTQSWCGEYERTMARIQMRGRNQQRLDLGDEINQRHAYDVDVSVDFDGEIDYVRSGLESALEAAADFSGSVSSVTFSATANITVYGIVADSEEDARGSIDIDIIRDNMGGIEFSEITDWTIHGTREDEDFDWDNYDED